MGKREGSGECRAGAVGPVAVMQAWGAEWGAEGG